MNDYQLGCLTASMWTMMAFVMVALDSPWMALGAIINAICFIFVSWRYVKKNN